jgi:hypothetical protein
MSSLFDITHNLKAIEEILENAEDPNQVSEMVAQSLQLQGQLKEKVENYANLIMQLEGLAELRKKEADRLAKLSKTMEARADRLREALKDGLKLINVQKISTDKYDVKIRKNGGLAPLAIREEHIIPDEWKKTKVEIELDKDKIRKALEDGEVLDFAELKERGDSLSIK